MEKFDDNLVNFIKLERKFDLLACIIENILNEEANVHLFCFLKYFY